MTTLMQRAGVVLALPLVLAACDPAGLDLGFGAEPTGTVSVGVYLDRDGSRTLNAPDTVYQGAVVQLRPQAGGAPIASVATTLAGIASFEEVPLGDYLVTVDPGSVGDSLVVAEVTEDSVRVSAAGNQVGATARLAYPELSVRQARLRPAGSRVFVRGLVLSGLQAFADQSSHLADTSLALRLTGLALLGGLTGNNPGDSVVVRGTMGQVNGQPVITGGTLIRVATRPAPVPKAVTSGVAATAQNGGLDADLVLVTSVTVSDSVSVGADFKVTASDGSGALTILLDSNIGFARTQFRPTRVLSVRGVLVPDGQGGWLLKPRATGDVTFLN